MSRLSRILAQTDVKLQKVGRRIGRHVRTLIIPLRRKSRYVTARRSLRLTAATGTPDLSRYSNDQDKICRT